MSKDSPLSRKIDTLVSDNTFDGNALHLGASAEPETVTHILQAIDDTMMLRNAVFAVGSSAVTLRISGKRLLKVVDVTQDLDAPDELIDQQLNADATEALEQLADVLRQLAAKPGALTLDRQIAEASTKPAGSGVGISALNTILEDKKKSDEQDAFATFLTTCTSLTTALVEQIDGKMNKISGRQPEIAKFDGVYGEIWANFEARYAAINSTTSSNSLQIVEISGSKEKAFAAVKVDENQYFMTLSLAKIPMLCSAWAKVADVR